MLVVEDEERVAGVLRRALEREGYAVDVAPDGVEAIWYGREHDYDAIVLDVMIPPPDGFEVIRQLRGSDRWAPVLLLTARDQVTDRVTGLDAGADDYLTKPFAVAELLARVRAMARRKISGRVLRYAGVELDRHQRSVTRAGRTISLTSREFELLEFLLSRAPHPAPRHEIIEHVWDLHFDPQTNLIEVYINRLRQKMSNGGESKIIQTIHGVGYCIREPE